MWRGLYVCWIPIWLGAHTTSHRKRAGICQRPVIFVFHLTCLYSTEIIFVLHRNHICIAPKSHLHCTEITLVLHLNHICIAPRTEVSLGTWYCEKCRVIVWGEESLGTRVPFVWGVPANRCSLWHLNTSFRGAVWYKTPHLCLCDDIVLGDETWYVT